MMASTGSGGGNTVIVTASSGTFTCSGHDGGGCLTRRGMPFMRRYPEGDLAVVHLFSGERTKSHFVDRISRGAMAYIMSTNILLIH